MKATLPHGASSVFQAPGLDPLLDHLGGLNVDFRSFYAHEKLVRGLVKDLPERVAVGLRHIALLVIKENLEEKKRSRKSKYMSIAFPSFEKFRASCEIKSITSAFSYLSLGQQQNPVVNTVSN